MAPSPEGAVSLVGVESMESQDRTGDAGTGLVLLNFEFFLFHF